VTWIADIGAPVTLTSGVPLALEAGRGRTAVPVRSALAATMLSVLAVRSGWLRGVARC